MISTSRAADLTAISAGVGCMDTYMQGLCDGLGVASVADVPDATLRRLAAAQECRDAAMRLEPEYIAYMARDAHLEQVRGAGMTACSLGAHRWSDVSDDRLAAAVAELNSDLH